MEKFVIYGDLKSGNCLKVKYTADYLGLSYDWQHVDVLKNETKTDNFLSKNPAGQVPIIKLSNDRYLAQSNAIIKYLALGSKLIPEDDYQKAKLDEWLFWEQYSHEPALAVLRFKLFYLKMSLEDVDKNLLLKSNQALSLMENHLKQNRFLLGERFSLADICLVAYTRMAADAQINLKNFSSLLRWIRLCENELKIETINL